MTWTRGFAVSLFMTVFGSLLGYFLTVRLGPPAAIVNSVVCFFVGAAVQVYVYKDFKE